MCVAVPMEITEIRGRRGVAAFLGNKTEIDLSLVPSLRIGDFALVHAGSAITKISRGEADEISDLFAELSEAAKF